MKIDVKALVRSKKAAIALASVLSSAAGAAAGYTYAAKTLEEKYRDLADEEVAATRQFYAAMQKPATPQEAAAELGLIDEDVDNEEEVKDAMEAASALRTYQGISIKDAEDKIEEEAEPMIEHNIFDSRFQQVPEEEGDKWDFDEQLALRADLVPGTPYIIHEDEYLANEREYTQTALTYFAEDDVLVDETDMPVDDVERAVGEDHLTKFGFGSNNATMVFVRNDRMEEDFEISLDKGSFARAIGFEDEDLQHSASRGVRKFRDYDE